MPQAFVVWTGRPVAGSTGPASPTRSGHLPGSTIRRSQWALSKSPIILGGWPLRAAFLALDTDLHLSGLEARIADMVGPTLIDMGYELVRVSVLGRDTPTVQIMADRADGSLIGVADCEAISHAVGAVMDVDDPIPGAWNLEVSSAGIDRPLTREKDWNRFSGHLARAETNMPIDGRKRFAGTVMGAGEGVGRLRVEDGTEVSLPLADIRKARLVLTDALIAASAQMAGVPSDEAPEAGEAPEAEQAPVPPQADGRQKGAKVGGARVGVQKTARKPGARPAARPGSGSGAKPGRKLH